MFFSSLFQQLIKEMKWRKRLIKEKETKLISLHSHKWMKKWNWVCLFLSPAAPPTFNLKIFQLNEGRARQQLMKSIGGASKSTNISFLFLLSKRREEKKCVDLVGGGAVAHCFLFINYSISFIIDSATAIAAPPHFIH